MRKLAARALPKRIILVPTIIMVLVLSAFLLAATAAGQDDGAPPGLVNPPVAQVKEKLAAAALARGIPPEALYALAYWQSGWRQFDSSGRPLVSPDGGIGVMQVTSYGNYNVSRLETDIDYNIDAGADILLAKLAETPRIGDGNKSVYENWFLRRMGIQRLDPRQRLPVPDLEPYNVRGRRSLDGRSGKRRSTGVA